MDFSIINPNAGTTLHVTPQPHENDILYADICLVAEEKLCLQPFSVSFNIPSVDMHSVWNSQTGGLGMRKLGPNWRKQTTDSRLTSGMPLHAVVSVDSRNRVCIAVSDIKTPLSIATGICEENACLECKITFFTQPTTAVTDYHATVRIDLRDVPFYTSITEAVSWWEEIADVRCAPIPDTAKRPMNSLWYTFHQNLNPKDILQQCALSKPLGMDTVILDDGWQTDDNHRGYAYCGDWDLATSKIPDMRRLAEDIHALGMKLMLWYSVPYLGIHSKKYAQFSNKTLSFDRRRGVAVLDPRYPEVREYLANIYEKAVTNWDLDGLKLDFVSAFRITDQTPKFDPAWDLESLEDAVERLMEEVTGRLYRRKSDLLIEFRQPYVGPAMRRYGNMLRAGDCPNDWLYNKTAILDLRLTSGITPVHSDMLMWHPQEPAEAAALQLAAVLFSVPQISVRLDEISADQLKMLQFYLDFWLQNRKLLLDGALSLSGPQAFYTKATARLGNEAITVVYTDTVVTKAAAHTIAVNCGAGRRLWLDGFENARYRIVNCMGEETESGTVCGIHSLHVPGGGMLYLS